MVTSVKVGDGKYEVLHENGAGLHALRYGKPWRDLTGDGLVLALVQRIEELESAPFGSGDLFWDAEETEDCATTLDDLLQQQADNGCLENGAIVEVLRARNLPRMVVSVTVDEDGRVDYKEVLPK